MFGTLVLALLILKTTLQHYVTPPSACLLSKFCNHTWVPECGQESAEKNKRMFLDLCDMHEYNCEQTKDYHKVDLKECPQDSTKLPTTDTTSTTTTEGTETATTTVATTKPSSESTAKPENITTKSTETTTFTTKITSISTESTAKPCSCSCIKATEVTSTTEPLIIYSSIATTLPSSETSKIETTVEQTTTPKTTSTLPSSETTKIETTIESTTMPNTTSVRHLFSECTCTKNITKITKNPVTTTTTEKIVTKRSTETTTLSSEPTNKDLDISQTTIDYYEETEPETYATTLEDIETETTQTETPTSPSVSIVTCSSYPEHCDVPSTWETTAKGETRDFFQILRERFGDRVRVLRATTHWPRRVLVNNQRSAFLNGRHWDSRMK